MIMKRSHGMICGLLLLMISATVGCGGTSTLNCSMTGINVSPQNASTGHTAPSNVQHFDGFAIAPAGCNSVAITAARLTNITWSTSDPVRVSISNVQDATYGNATCNSATSGAVTITATAPNGNGSNVTGTASLTCL